MELGILISAVIVHALLALFVLSNDSRSSLNRAFALLNASSAAWSIATYFSTQSLFQETTLFWMRLTMFFAAPQAFFFMMTVLSFPDSKKVFSTKITYILTGILLATMALTLSPFVFSGVKSESGSFSPIVAPGMLLFVLTAVGSVMAGGISLIYKFVKSTSALRKQLRSLLVGLGLTFSLIVIFNFIFVVLVNNSDFVVFGPLFTFPFLIAATYAITRHGLFNIKVIVAEVTVAGLAVINFAQLFTANSSGEIIFRLIALLMVVVVGYLLVRSVQTEVRRREEVEMLAKEKTETLKELEQKNKNLAVLQKISDVVLNENDMKLMAQKILDELPNQLEACAGGLLSIVKNGQLVAYAMSSNQFTNKILSLVGGDLAKYSFPIKKGFNQIHDVLVERQAKDSELLSDFISPPIPKTLALTIQKMIGIKHIESFPLYAGGEPFGVMTFVFTEKGESVHEKNYSIARAISDDMSLAIQRAQAFNKLKEANDYLAQLDKMKDEFILIASHELYTPLEAIEGYL